MYCVMLHKTGLSRGQARELRKSLCTSAMAENGTPIYPCTNTYLVLVDHDSQGGETMALP